MCVIQIFRGTDFGSIFSRDWGIGGRGGATAAAALLCVLRADVVAGPRDPFASGASVSALDFRATTVIILALVSASCPGSAWKGGPTNALFLDPMFVSPNQYMNLGLIQT